MLTATGILRRISFPSFASTYSTTMEEMDEIRARSLLKHTYVYNPPDELDNIIFLLDLGRSLKHLVPNSKLHKMKSLRDLFEFYEQPVNNITKYAELARNEKLPQNLAIMEQPRRFHPNDKTALHGGVTGNPGEGGTIYSIRNKRIYREFKPKKEWFDYDDQNFDYDVTLSKGMPWDPEIANKMDSYTNIRFTKEYLRKMR
uniref:Large ribosomal subunit protein mL50 n=1 Tax=Meloidogyne javanica TaxID=6303 RepID=A0A915LDV8_MELJA